jgi:deazaflavin-dependent oxidoreductase (nitroreductase family)
VVVFRHARLMGTEEAIRVPAAQSVSMTTIPATSPTPKPTLAHWLIRASGPIMSPFAGRRFFPLWAILEHTGRKSGRSYATPVVARRVADGFIIPMAFGEKTDWVRNVLASGTATIVWKGRRYQTDHAESIDRAQAAPVFDWISRTMMPVLVIERFVRVRGRDPR